jgi:hypothetical protein
LEDRVVPSTVPAVGTTHLTLPGTATAAVLGQPSPSLPSAPDAIGQPSLVQHVDALFQSLLTLGGGHQQEVLHFPASGGGHSEGKPPIEPSTTPEAPGIKGTQEEEIFSSALWIEEQQHPAVDTVPSDAALTQAAEALVEAAAAVVEA